MINVKLGNKIFKDVDKIKVNTDDGNAVVFDEPPESYDGEIFSEPGTVSEVMGLNIAYGDTAPEDTSKLWVKCDEPKAIEITSDIIVGNEEIEIGVGALPTVASDMASAAVGNKVYLFGGYGYGNRLDTINVFNAESNSITTLNTKLPTAASEMASAVVGNKVYLFGGYSGSAYLNTINVFDATDNSITTLNTKLPTGAYGIASAVVGTKVYLFGGFSGRYLETINVFNTETNTITTVAKLPTGANGITSVEIGTKVYLFGGYYYSNNILIFDVETNAIITLDTKLPTGASDIISAVIGTKVYLFGGYYDNKYLLNTINVFDAESNSITTLNTKLPTAASDIASAVVGTKVYLFGGFGGSSMSDASHSLDTINKFIVALPLATNKLLIESAIGKNPVQLINSTRETIKIGVKNVYLGNSEGYAEKVPAYLYVDGAWTEI
jgi:N-acetylneuraminic acid mutarotase